MVEKLWIRLYYEITPTSNKCFDDDIQEDLLGLIMLSIDFKPHSIRPYQIWLRALGMSHRTNGLMVYIWNKIAGRRVFVRFYLRSWNWKRHGAIPSAPLDIGNESVIWKPGPGHGNIVNIEIQRRNFLHARQKYLPQERPCHNDYSQLFQHA